MQFRECASNANVHNKFRNDRRRRAYSRCAQREFAVAVVECEGPESGGGRSCEASCPWGRVEVVSIWFSHLVPASNLENSQIIHSTLYNIAELALGT